MSQNGDQLCKVTQVHVVPANGEGKFQVFVSVESLDGDDRSFTLPDLFCTVDEAATRAFHLKHIFEGVVN